MIDQCTVSELPLGSGSTFRQLDVQWTLTLTAVPLERALGHLYVGRGTGRSGCSGHLLCLSPADGALSNVSDHCGLAHRPNCRLLL